MCLFNLETFGTPRLHMRRNVFAKLFGFKIDIYTSTFIIKVSWKIKQLHYTM